MTPPALHPPVRLRTAVVLDADENFCTTWSTAGRQTVDFAPPFPSPRRERVSPGHLVAIAERAGDRSFVVWRWFDAVVLDGADPSAVRLWEPGHGVVTARAGVHHRTAPPGSRVHLSAGLPGADWWAAGPVPADPGTAAVERDAVLAFFDASGLWDAVFATR